MWETVKLVDRYEFEYPVGLYFRVMKAETSQIRSDLLSEMREDSGSPGGTPRFSSDVAIPGSPRRGESNEGLWAGPSRVIYNAGL